MNQPPPAGEPPQPDLSGPAGAAGPEQSPSAAEPTTPGTGVQAPPSAPDAQPAPTRPRRRLLWIAAAAVAVLLVAAGITWWAWPSGLRAVPGTVQATVLPPEEVSKALGQTLQSRHGISEPPPALTADPLECAVAVGPATQAVYAGGWTAFGSVTDQDSDTQADHTVTQVIGVYPSSDDAKQVFTTLTNGITHCPTAVRAGGAASHRASQWNYELHNATAETLSWVATQDPGDSWACHRQARLKDRTVLQVAVCQAGDSRQAAAAIADKLLSRMGG